MDNQYSMFEFEDMIFPYYPKGIADSWNYDDWAKNLWKFLMCIIS